VEKTRRGPLQRPSPAPQDGGGARATQLRRPRRGLPHRHRTQPHATVHVPENARRRWLLREWAPYNRKSNPGRSLRTYLEILIYIERRAHQAHVERAKRTHILVVFVLDEFHLLAPPRASLSVGWTVVTQGRVGTSESRGRSNAVTGSWQTTQGSHFGGRRLRRNVAPSISGFECSSGETRAAWAVAGGYV